MSDEQQEYTIFTEALTLYRVAWELANTVGGVDMPTPPRKEMLATELAQCIGEATTTIRQCKDAMIQDAQRRSAALHRAQQVAVDMAHGVLEMDTLRKYDVSRSFALAAENMVLEAVGVIYRYKLNDHREFIEYDEIPF